MSLSYARFVALMERASCQLLQDAIGIQANWSARPQTLAGFRVHDMSSLIDFGALVAQVERARRRHQYWLNQSFEAWPQ